MPPSEPVPQAPRCSVLIATWRRPGPLRELLDSLAQERDCEVIVVSDGEDAATRALSHAYSAPYPLRWLSHSRNLGQAAARNTAAAAARGEYLLVLDDDVLIVPGLVRAHLAAHDSANDRRTIVGGRITEERLRPCVSPTDRLALAQWERALEHSREIVSSLDAGPSVEQTVHFGLNCSIARELFERHGGFDPQIRVTEDMEFGQRLYAAGVRFVYEPRALVRHRNEKPMADYFRASWYIGGKTDVIRARNGERSRPLEYLADHCNTGGKGPQSFFADHNGCSHRLADLLQRVTDLTGSRVLFEMWWRIAQRASYWEGAKAAGPAEPELRDPGKPACVLAFHSISAPRSREEGSYYVSPARFRRRLAWIKATGHGFSALTDWLRSPGGNGRPLLTFDDGYDDLYTELFPAMMEFGLQPLIFLVSGQIGGTNVWDERRGLRTRRLLTADQIREMQAHGAHFGSHSVSHPWLPALSNAELRHEVTDSKHRLEDLLGREMAAFAYPYGGVDQRVRAAVIEAGYKLAFTVQPGLNRWNDRFYLLRTEVDDRSRLPEFIFQLATGHHAIHWLAGHVRRLRESAPTKNMRSAAEHTYDLGRRLVRWHARRQPSTTVAPLPVTTRKVQ
jgi:peptidoglycan/xylan/chitin deacetylase (PgdA/CDA1 family)/GT2 family glycosyltransferase